MSENLQKNNFFIPPVNNDQEESIRAEIVDRIKEKFGDLLDKEDQILLSQGTLGLDALAKKYREKYIDKTKKTKLNITPNA